MPRVGRDFENWLEHLLVSWEPDSGQEDVGQQEVPWDSRDTAVGVPGDMLKARREGRQSGELGRAKCKVCEVVEESV